LLLFRFCDLNAIMTADGRRQTADGRRQTADGRRQTADGSYSLTTPQIGNFNY